MDPSLYRCKWDRYSGALIDLWHQYVLLVKKGGSPLIYCPPHLYDVAECEVLAEAQLARKKREQEEAAAFLKAQGYLK